MRRTISPAESSENAAMQGLLSTARRMQRLIQTTRITTGAALSVTQTETYATVLITRGFTATGIASAELQERFPAEGSITAQTTVLSAAATMPSESAALSVNPKTKARFTDATTKARFSATMTIMWAVSTADATAGMCLAPSTSAEYTVTTRSAVSAAGENLCFVLTRELLPVIPKWVRFRALTAAANAWRLRGARRIFREQVAITATPG